METFSDKMLITGMLLLGILVIHLVDQDPRARSKRVRWIVVFSWMLSLATIIGFILGFSLLGSAHPSPAGIAVIVVELLSALLLIGGGIGVWLKNRLGLVLWLLGIIWQVSSYAVNHMQDMSAPHILLSPLAAFIVFLFIATICFSDGKELWDAWSR